MNKLMELKSIQLNSKVVVETEDGVLLDTLFIKKGYHVRLAYNTLLDVRDNAPANYTIQKCIGDIFSTHLEIELIGNNGNEYKLILK
jgi:hypothetical protein